FFRAHGEAFCRRERSLREWQAVAGDVADATFTDFLREYPLAGDGAVEAQRRRLRRDVGYLLRAEWESPLRFEFGQVEGSFGYPTPVALRLDAEHVLHVHGFIDRIDRATPGLVVRDVKTGTLEPGPDARPATAL